MQSLELTSNPWISGVIWGILFSLVYLFVIPYHYSTILLALFSAAMPGVYWGFGVKGSKKCFNTRNYCIKYFFYYY